MIKEILVQVFGTKVKRESQKTNGGGGLRKPSLKTPNVAEESLCLKNLL
jgi:hypothetical protein